MNNNTIYTNLVSTIARKLKFSADKLYSIFMNIKMKD